MSSIRVQIPRPLAHGGHIRVVSPGLPTIAHVPERARRAEAALRSLGLDVSYGAHARSISYDGLTAGSAAERAADLLEAFEDASVDAILVSDSGLGSRAMLPYLDAGIIAAHAKPFIGYCDTCYLHQYMVSRAGVSSIYGCALMVQLAEGGGPFPETLGFFRHLLTTSEPLVCRPLGSRTAQAIDFYVPEEECKRRRRDIEGSWTWLRTGRSRGQLLGAELSILPDLIRCFELSLDSVVLFWDISTHNRDKPVRPLFEALCASAAVSRLAGMIVGLHPAIAPPAWAAQVKDLLEELIPKPTFPVVVNADLSHTDPSWIVPYGEEVLLDDTEGIVFPRKAAEPWHGV
jgi:muramoyltetrapeptide carboxypeptidase LdcA involved in peptidoglycan recycling